MAGPCGHRGVGGYTRRATHTKSSEKSISISSFSILILLVLPEQIHTHKEYTADMLRYSIVNKAVSDGLNLSLT